MELHGEQRISLGRQAVWDALNDPGVLKSCIPMCESVEKDGDNEFRIAMMAAVGPVRARFKATMKYAQVDAPRACTMVFEAQGGPAGFGKGDAKLTLAEDGPVTVLGYRVSAKVGGKLAQIGSRLVDAAAAKVADEFFARFNEVVVKARAAPADPGSLPVAAPARRLPKVLIAIVVVAVLALLAYLLRR